jgi:hypothetical protein
MPYINQNDHFIKIEEKAATGVPALVNQLLTAD